MPHEAIVTMAVLAVGVITAAVLLLRTTLNSRQQHSTGQQNSSRRNRPEPTPSHDRMNDNGSHPNRTEEENVTINCDLCGYVILSDAPRQTLSCSHSFHPICYNDFREQMCRACMREFY